MCQTRTAILLSEMCSSSSTSVLSLLNACKEEAPVRIDVNHFNEIAQEGVRTLRTRSCLGNPPGYPARLPCGESVGPTSSAALHHSKSLPTTPHSPHNTNISFDDVGSLLFFGLIHVQPSFSCVEITFIFGYSLCGLTLFHPGVLS